MPFNNGYSMCTDECYKSDDYCRCRRVIDCEIESVNIDSILDKILSNNFSEIEKYCLDRILRYSLNDISLYKVNIHDDYYGEITSGVSIINKKSILKKVYDLAGCESDYDKIIYSLNNEYGYILDELKSRNYSDAYIKSIAIDDIIYNKSHYFRLNKGLVDSYNEHDGPRCVVYKDANKYILIDGHHRLMSAKNIGLSEADVVCLDYR